MVSWLLSQRTMKINVKDRIITIALYKTPLKGVVEEVIKFNPKNPIEDHGFIQVRFDNGDIEHFCHYGWEKTLKIIPKGSC